jgi:hypothetical protein
VLFLTAGLSISLGIFYIVLVQLQINRGARESHKAFYAADIAKECAAYYRNYVNAAMTGGFWSADSPCGGIPGNGTACESPTNPADPNLVPFCKDAPVFRTSTMDATPQIGVDYDVGIGDLEPADPLIENWDGPDHTFQFSVSTDNTCADATIIVKKRIVGGFPGVRIETRVDGLSHCNGTQAMQPVNRSFLECISPFLGDCQ